MKPHSKPLTAEYVECTINQPRGTVNPFPNVKRIKIMPAETRLFICRSDNYGVLLHDPGSGATAAIDAPDAAPIDAALKATGWKLTDILVTHHHADHTDGIRALKDKHKCRVVAPAGEAS
jgi:hydroxyacylglutathione hydrolase